MIWAIFLNKVGFVTSYWKRIEGIWQEWARVVFCGGVQEDMFLAFWPSNFCPMLRSCVAVTFLVIFMMIKVYK